MDASVSDGNAAQRARTDAGGGFLNSGPLFDWIINPYVEKSARAIGVTPRLTRSHGAQRKQTASADTDFDIIT